MKLGPSALDPLIYDRTAFYPPVFPFPAAVAGPQMPTIVACADGTRKPFSL